MRYNILELVNKSKIQIILLLFTILTIFPTVTQAVSVPVNYTGSWSYRRGHGRVNCGSGGLSTRTDFGMYLNKQFDLTASGVKTLAQNESAIIPTGVNLVASNYPTTGSYWYSSGDYATPPMDGQVYNWNYDVGVACRDMVKMENQMIGGIPVQLDYILTSSNNAIIDCSGRRSCTTRSDGSATVTVSFPGAGYYYVERRYKYYAKPVRWMMGARSGSWQVAGPLQWINGQTITGAWNYTLNPISYTMTVRNPNQPPIINNINTNNISYNTATANWSYTDPEGDIQRGSHVQIATDSGFSNIVYNNGQNGAGTSMSISGLQPGTIYYPRVRVWNNENGWTGWINGPAFTTLVNNPPNLDLLSCGATSEPTNYERARLTWNYTGTDEPGDQLVLRARWKRSPEDTNWQVFNLPSDKTGGLDMRNLISGYTYELQVSLNDNRNSHLGDRWKGCGTVTPPNYPEPTVEFSLNKTGDINTAVQKGGTLTLKTGDRVSSNWNITNNIGVVGNSCKISSINTIGGDNTVIYNNTGLGFTGNNVLGNNLPVNINDQRYIISLECAGRTAKTPRSINETITLVVESYPTVSCNIQGDKIVKEGDTSIDINAQVGNVASYIWEAGPDSGDKTRKKQSGNSPIPNPLRLDYTGLDFGKYTPWVSVTKLGTNRTTPVTCGAITNFGSSNIKEVN